MRQIFAIAAAVVLAGSGCASAGDAGASGSAAVSHLDRGTAARLADEGAVPDRAAAAGATGGELSGSAR